MAGIETAHLFPFRAALLQCCKQADFLQVQDVQERFKRFPVVNAMGAGGMLTSTDGLVSVLCGARQAFRALTLCFPS